MWSNNEEIGMPKISIKVSHENTTIIGDKITQKDLCHIQQKMTYIPPNTAQRILSIQIALDSNFEEE